MRIITHRAGSGVSVIETVHDPSEGGAIPRVLIIMICHPDSVYRVEATFCTISNIMGSFSGTGVRPVVWVISTEGAKHADMLRTYMDGVAEWIELPNSEWLDFGRLEMISHRLPPSDRIIMVNDSVVLLRPVRAFIDLVLHSNKDLVGFMESAEVRPHYPTFLFGVSASGFARMIKFIQKTQAENPPSREACIHKIEIMLPDLFEKRVAHLIIDAPDLKARNVFYENDKVYSAIIKYVPVIKIRRLLQNKKAPFDHYLLKIARIALNE